MSVHVVFVILIFLGGIFGNDELCTTGKKCKRHEVYKDTLNPCPLTCAQPNPRPCPFMPINKGGCECAPGYVRDEDNGECVRPKNCSAKTCKDSNAEYTVCPNPCPSSCGNPFPGVCTKLCVREGCQCAKGFILDIDNIELGKCIRPEDCPEPICPQNEQYVMDDNQCQKTCGNRLSPNSDTAGACVPFTGCVCKPDNVRLYDNATGPCIPETECPPIPTECGENEVATSCRIICPPQSCESIFSSYYCPPTECEPGCDCKSNYLRNKDGVCIPSDDCFKTDPIVCGENEVASDCAIQCPPQSCESLFVEYLCAETNCTTGCNCIAGHLRNSLGVCVPSEECYNDPAGCDGDVNATRSRGCGTSNPPTCENPNPEITTDVCILNGCECKPGYIKSSRDGKCVEHRDCPAEFGCKGYRNATLKYCPTPCPKTCDDPNAGSEGCIEICLPEDCECNAGYVWTQKEGGKCIKLEDCPSCKGDTKAHFSYCPSACEPSCDNPKPEICTKQCMPPGCVCNTGYVLSKNGTCINPNDCPAPIPTECGENEVATSCRKICPPQACESINAKYFCEPTECEPGCDCKKNYLRNKDGVCIHSDNCFKTNPMQCGENEVPSDCAIQCPPQSCESLFVNYLCAAKDGCTPGCNCITGYLRNSLGECVPSKECYNDPAGCDGDVNATRSRGCGSANSPTFENPNPETTTVLKTTKVCRLNGCECKPGYIKSSIGGKCVEYKDCPEPVCPENEYYTQNNTRCIRTCANKAVPISDDCKPVTGCVCKDGLVRENDDATGKCIPESECPGCNGDPNATYKECRSQCPLTCDNPEPRTCILSCAPAGCECNEGYVLSPKGICVNPKDCPVVDKGCGGDQNATAAECPSSCPPTCANRNSGKETACPAVCDPSGCVCKRGYILTEKGGKCVKPEDCPDLGCNRDVNAIFSDCPSACEPTCTKPNPRKCTRQCMLPGCVCKPDYVLNEKTGKCVKPETCPVKGCNGDDNAVYSECPSACEPTCANPDPNQLCTYQCLTPGCVCKPGFVRNNKTGKCIKPETCLAEPQCKGDRNATYTKDPSQCQITCKYPDPKRQCSNKKSEPSCVCKQGYLKKKNKGPCIKPEDCPGGSPQCRANETFLYCYVGCPTNYCPVDDSRAIVACDPPYPCPMGCGCEGGYLMVSEEDNRCILSSDCPPVKCTRPNEVWDPYAPGCLHERCDDRNIPCDYQYPGPPQCRCIEGYYRNQEDVCVPESECPQPGCNGDMNATFSGCTSLCPATCGDTTDLMCIALCGEPGCVCNSGFILSEPGGVCIRPEDCAPQACNGDKNATLSGHPNPCPPVCCDPDSERTCPDTDCSKPGCECNYGYILSEYNGVCISPNDCEGGSPYCRANMTYTSCKIDCPMKYCPTSVDEVFVVCDPIWPCPTGCECEQGYLMTTDGSCILAADCPALECPGPHEVWDPSPSNCNNDRCEALYYNCDDPTPGRPRCVCQEGFYRDINDICVPAEECPESNCGYNEVEVPCRQICPPQNCEIAYTEYACTEETQICERGCDCLPDHLRNGSGICIPNDQCPYPSTPVCGINEIARDCRRICPPQTCLSKYALFRCVADLPCEPGCDCVPNYLRNDEGICIPSEKCPPLEHEPTCGYNEVAVECRQICPPQNCDIAYTDYTCTDNVQICEPGCDCLPNHLRNGSGICVPNEECPYPSNLTCGINEIARNCRQICPPQSCQSKYIMFNCIHDIPCEPGCDCVPNYLRDAKGICIPSEKCSPPCLIYDECKRTCASPNPPNCDYNPPKENLDGSDCKEGYILSELRGKCIPIEECPPDVPCNGDPNAIVKRCPKPCPSTCDSPDEIPCKRACLALECECKPGYLLSNATGTCILPDQCPGGNPCGENSRFVDCKATNCPREYCPVDDSREIQSCDPPSDRCLSGCICGLNHKRKSVEEPECIVSSDCPPVNCTRPNEEWSSCPSACLRENCEDVDDQPTVCNTLVLNCEPSCICKKDHFRNSSGICIPAHDCPKGCGGDDNAVFSDCPSVCETTCTSPEDQACTDQCDTPRCVCKTGFVKKDGKCIKKENCPA